MTRRQHARTVLAGSLALLAFAGLASAQVGKLGPGDAQLASGEYFDRYPYQGRAGERLHIAVASDEIDPYLIILDAEDQPLFEEDDSDGAGLNVDTTFALPADGSYTVVVTSATPGEAGRYSLTLAGDAGAPGTTPSPAVAGGDGAATTAVEPNSVSGLVVDTAGRPIAGAKVWIQPGLTTGLVEVRTDADGRYRATNLIDVPYNAKAWTEVTYQGQRFCLRLGMPNPADYDSFVPQHGAERNFRWQLTGVIEDLKEYNEYFGGMVRVMNIGYYTPLGDTLELTFTPTGPLIDGSPGAAFTRTLDLSAGSDVYDIPVGPYTVTAELVAFDGGRYALRIGPDIFDTGHDTLAIDWQGDGTCVNGSGVGWNYLWLDDPND